MKTDMGDVGDYWREHRTAVRHKESTGLWPGQKFCEDCGLAFYFAESWHTRCPRCHRKKKEQQSC